MEKYLQSYLKERNIPINSLEANSIQEGYQLAVKRAWKWLEPIAEYIGHDSETLKESFKNYINGG